MPHHCAVPGCTSNSKRTHGVSFHKFPADADRRCSWVTKIRRDERKGVWTVNSSSRVCSLHFTEESYYASGRKRERKTARTSRMLKVTAVPTVFDCFLERLQPNSSKRKPPAIREEPQPKRKRRSEVDGRDAQDSISLSQNDGGDLEHIDDSCAGGQHDHCVCVEPLQCTVESLQSTVESLQRELDDLKSKRIDDKATLEKEKSRRDFCLDRFKGDNKKMRYYTGFVTYVMFQACFDFLFQSAKEMRTWQGKRTSTGERNTEKSGPKPKLPLKEQFFLVMVRLRLGLNVEDLADRFYINPSTVSRTFTTWINLMYAKFKELPMWMSRSKVNKWMPPCFKKWYPTTRVIIYATEFSIEKPSSLARQSATWSAYKNHNTFKVLVGTSPDGTIVYISHLYEGSVSDVDLVQQCGFLSVLERGDSIMADKGFDIQHLLSGLGVCLNIPPFRRGDKQFTLDDIMKTRKIAAVRVHVERAMNRIKQYELVSRVIPNCLWDIAEQLVFVAGYLTNLEHRLVA